MDKRLRLNNDPDALVPKNLLKFELYKNLDTLYRSLPNDDQIISWNNAPTKVLDAIIRDYLSVVNYNKSEVEKRYITKRLLALKSAEEVLWELERYSNIEFDVSIKDNTVEPPILATRYSPNELVVTIETIETDKSSELVDMLTRLFCSILYFRRFELHIKNLIIRLALILKLESNSYLTTVYNVTNLTISEYE
jgi:hypothetical protein